MTDLVPGTVETDLRQVAKEIAAARTENSAGPVDLVSVTRDYRAFAAKSNQTGLR
jgi:hypothetical protein